MFMYEERAGPVSGRKDLKEHFPAICMQVVSDLPYLVWDSPQFAGFWLGRRFWCVEICRSLQYCAVVLRIMLFWGVGIYRIMKRYCVFRYNAEFGVRRYALGDARVHLCPPLPNFAHPPNVLMGKLACADLPGYAPGFPRPLTFKLLCLKHL